MNASTRSRVHLVSGLLERSGNILIVASRYPNHPQPLWNLPGGRQRHGELLTAALRREFVEETGLHVRVGPLRYVAESYDAVTECHFTNFAFGVDGDGEPSLGTDAHVVALEWVARGRLTERLSVAVVREPLLANLEDPRRRYFAFAEAGITIEFADAP